MNYVGIWRTSCCGEKDYAAQELIEELHAARRVIAWLHSSYAKGTDGLYYPAADHEREMLEELCEYDEVVERKR